jgi:hypothetical protein
VFFQPGFFLWGSLKFKNYRIREDNLANEEIWPFGKVNSQKN